MKRAWPAPFVVIALVLGLSSGAMSAAPQSESLRVVDLPPRFLEFHARARDVDDADERFALWKEHYDFVPLPPGLPDRDERARQMLDEVWPRYAGVLDRLESGVEVLSPAPETVIGRVAELLDLRGALPDGTLVVALPAEMAPERRELAMAHEFLDAYHHVLSEGVLVDDGSVGALVLSEGVAMYATRALFPDVSDARHLGGEQGWVEACHGRIDQVLTDAMTGES